ncbi:MAG: aminoglycoside phosphotransferase [Desulfobacteraceae bacterium]|jgi:aminoglycoside/choline kinase family phosphotransferase/dTDP-glucose pyrophosphorylase|nr:MAG: aminoglycoside phosphotransferase [Desulfobacteraceae bacterium]
MKALILAAGFGTRLLPHTRILPKPLFPIAGRPAIDVLICQLARQGYDQIIINTHHLHDDINTFIRQQNYPIAVTVRFEPEILGTGGAIRNVADFMGHEPFLVINSDIFTDLDMGRIMRIHQAHPHPVTLVMHDYPEFNKVWVDAIDHVKSFDPAAAPAVDAAGCRLLAFTGIQVLDPEVIDFIHGQGFSSSIDAYRKMIRRGRVVQAHIVRGHRWHDIGSPAGYADAVMDAAGPAAFDKAFGRKPHMPLTKTRLAGDGSDRKWYRLSSGDRRLIVADHGIRMPGKSSAYPASEAAAFVRIGEHLLEKGINVARIYDHDEFSGLVFVADLGDENLQARVGRAADKKEIIDCYKKVIDALIPMSVLGSEGFDPAWTCQTPAYDRQLILERECRYFVEAFLNGYLDMGIDYETLAPEFQKLADLATVDAVIGFMHRDLQSRNIMIAHERPFFIDFQGGRLGPIQYDLASLLNDPYVDLSENTCNILLNYYMDKLEQVRPINRKSFTAGYYFCGITRLLQALGAFGYLTRIKAKPGFASYMPIALKTLQNRLDSNAQNLFIQLRDTVVSARKKLALQR